jgi:hypothetical protein
MPGSKPYITSITPSLQHADYVDYPTRCLNRLPIRAALPITSNELNGMVIAATSGLTSAIMANGTIITL